MTDEEIKAARAIIEAAVGGPWTVEDNGLDRTVLDESGMWVGDIGNDPGSAAFIAAARTGWPAALDEIEAACAEHDDQEACIVEQQREIDAMRAIVEHAVSFCAFQGDQAKATANWRALQEAVTAYRSCQEDDKNRCAVCGWTLASVMDNGCVRGNCSLRPRPDRLYAPDRAAKESHDR